MRRIYFLLPDVDSAQTIINELLLLRVEWRHIHVIANHNVPLKELPEATLAQRSDLLPAMTFPAMHDESMLRGIGARPQSAAAECRLRKR